MFCNNYPDNVIDNRDIERSDISFSAVIGTHSPITNEEKQFFREFKVKMFNTHSVYMNAIRFEDRIVTLHFHAKPSVAPLQIVNEFKSLSASKLNDVFQEMDSSYSFYWFEDYFITTEALTINDLNDFRAARIV